MRLRLSSLAGTLVLGLAITFQTAWGALPSEKTSGPDSKDPTDANIALMEADILQNWQYSQHPFDTEIAGKFLDRYLETLDYSHIYFLQSDLNEFNAYRTNLNVLTLQDHNITPCWV